MTDTKAQAGDLIKVKLQAPHTHGGKDYKEGEEIAVRPDQLDRLKKHKKV
ncbi:hypothetical protein SAMN04487957_10591 [Halomonas shengliensis]|uniref:DUF7210 domain-containing protein n=1 Tax=Halomonas shengliensis TaxID=419597 RepID=A0A1H0IEC8_9GAMM|nr:hypothetical protein [Halomonas shengliensis]SDO29829.1 hypothetical protein SAMN04487957_10591 [Halomonas shengliensis]